MSSLLREIEADVLERLGPAVADLTIERAVLGLFFVGVKLSNDVAGMCATPLKAVPQAVCCPSSAQAMPAPGKVRGRPVRQALEDLYRGGPLRRALAIATLNALVETVWRKLGSPDGILAREGDALAALRVDPHHHVVLVGAFPPYMREFIREERSFHVLELDASVLKPEELPFFVPASQAADTVPHAHALVVTGTTLINDTLDGLLDLARPGTEIAVIGPTVPLLPGPFARRGVRVMGGVRVTEPDTLLDCLAEGGSGYHVFGKSAQRVTLRVEQRTPPCLTHSGFCPRFH
ncbi:MAG TPA: DUF364 domain-containing protein [Thiobacillaceae bacterium]|nr:DUF364 domain-containing protein [Thiobacillaceae bacterium]HNU65440.1 DUF364 domain-containing protein [Thiobacillaceae bacterium]